MSIQSIKRTLWLPALLAAATLNARAQAVFTVSDFEDKAAANKFSDYSEWAFSSDADSHGNSVITSGDTIANPSLIDSTSFASPGYGTSATCLKMAYKYGTTRPHGDAPDTSSYDPEVGLFTAIFDDSSNTWADFTGATKVSFWAKADKPTKIRFAAATPEVIDYAFWGDDFTVGTAWKQFNLDFSAKTFTQPDWKSAAVPFNIRKISEFLLGISQANNPGAGGTLYLDDVTVTGWQPKLTSTALRAEARALRNGIIPAEGGRSARIGLSGMGNRAGTVKVFGISGKLLGMAGFASGAREVTVPMAAASRGGILFYRVEAATGR
ncbi:MAG: hypothetical protein JWO30_1701 [Fibrobacteres bacterium]|nr:hypothetical protein [Fibrobacterota bacterium]